MSEREKLARLMRSAYGAHEGERWVPWHEAAPEKQAAWLAIADAILASDWLRDTLAAEREAAIAAMPAPGWQDIASAPRDGTSVLVRLHSDIYPRICPERPDLERWNGIAAVMRNHGLQYLDWGFAAPVGQGGFPDEWMVGWQPLPAPPGADPAPAPETPDERQAAIVGALRANAEDLGDEGYEQWRTVGDMGKHDCRASGEHTALHAADWIESGEWRRT